MQEQPNNNTSQIDEIITIYLHNNIIIRLNAYLINSYKDIGIREDNILMKAIMLDSLAFINILKNYLDRIREIIYEDDDIDSKIDKIRLMIIA